MSVRDLIIIGGGPGGYRAAELAAEKGKSVTLFEEKHIGGVCLNVGCIPTKTLLNAAKIFKAASHGSRFGVQADAVRFDMGQAVAYKNEVVGKLTKGVGGELKRVGVEVIEGRASLTSRTTVECNGASYEAKNIVLATGSSSAMPPIPGLAESDVKTSTEMLDLTAAPKRVGIIGGGYIGMEFASFFSTTGSEVTVIEMFDEIIPFMDAKIAKQLRSHLKSVTFKLGCKVERVDGRTVHFSDKGQAVSDTFDEVLISVGRTPNTKGLGLEAVGVEVVRGAVRVDDHMKTNIPGVYAIGDVTGRSLLAHSAYRMAAVVVDRMFGERTERFRSHAIPWVVFTLPEVAGCGLTEAGARDAGYDVVSAQLPASINGRFLAEHPDERGLCKVIADRKTHRILGVHLLGTGVSEIIHSAALMIEHEMRTSDVVDVIYPHPTVSELVYDTVRAVDAQLKQE
ncbi:MAG: dihydrolipoyl dehydrogenase [Spirochaetaceae bacterium]|nr:MAG: dihydrolipoyl dehydrogenase [Spirochaetaceae bacterium]